MTDEELRVLAWTLLGEAAGEGTSGMTAVAHVIRNRSMSGRFPSNPASVALDKAQFSTWNALGNGGNIPRARYPVGTASFNKALSVVDKVFGDTPGKDPTQGATHYYAPQGMAGGSAPYWWRSEAKLGEKKIGNHVFAVRRNDAEAPIPVSRRATSSVDYYPTKGQLDVLRTGKGVELPKIGATGGPSLMRDAPVPAKQSLQMQVRREDAGATVKSIQTVTLFDPVRGAEVKRLPSASDMVRKAQAPAKVVQRVAGFSVPEGVDGVTKAENLQKLLNNSKVSQSYAGQEREIKTIRTTGAASTFGPDVRLPVTPDIPEVAPTEAQRKPFQQIGPQLPAVKIPVPQQRLEVRQEPTYYRDTRSEPSPVTFRGTSTGNTYVAGQLYQTASGAKRAESDGSFTNVSSGAKTPGSFGGSRSDGHLSYNPDTASWER